MTTTKTTNDSKSKFAISFAMKLDATIGGVQQPTFEIKGDYTVEVTIEMMQTAIRMAAAEVAKVAAKVAKSTK